MFGRWLTKLVAGLGGLGMLACGSVRPEVGVHAVSLARGDSDGPPAFAALPDLGTSQQSPRMQQGFSLARQVLANGLPTPPDDRQYRQLQAWIDGTVAPWIAQRRDGVDETRFQFALDDGAASPEVAVARGVLGLMHENTALELSHIPSPAELDSEPEIAEMFHELVATQAKPFVNAAMGEYRKCAELAAAEGGELTRWARFCAARHEHLRRPVSAPEALAHAQGLSAKQ
jgi:hypothetical protein